MRMLICRSLTSIMAAVVVLATPLASAPFKAPTYQQFMNADAPQELVAAKKADRIAWVDYAEGKRNAYAASAPLFTPVRLTNFQKDDGIMMSEVQISDDGSTVIFLRGEAPNRAGWSPNPSADPNGPEHAIWAARTNVAGGAWRVADAANPELAPDGSAILFVKEGQIFRAKLTPVKPASEVDRGEKALITEWGVQSDPVWSPDGRRIAFVSTRNDHSFIVVYDVATKSVKYMSPSVDFDTTPMWMADSRHLIFMRQPGLPFGQETLMTGASTGAAYASLLGPAPGQGFAGRAGARGAQAAPATGTAPVNRTAGIMQAVFKGGYTLGFWKADATTGDAEETWHNRPSDPIVANLMNVRLAGDLVIFEPNTNGGRGRAGGRRGANAEAPAAANQAPVDEWERYYSLRVGDASARPVLLTTTDGLIENSESVALSADGKTLLLLHQRQRHRAAAHLGRAGNRGHAGGDHDRRRRGDIAGAAGIGQVPGDAKRGLEHAAIGGRLEDDGGSGRASGSAEDCFPHFAAGLSDRRPCEAGDRDDEGR